MSALLARRRCDDHDGLGLQIAQMIEAAGIDVYVLGRLEGQGKVSALGHTLVIEQILDAHVVAGVVATTSATAKTQCRAQIVIHTTQSADAAWRIDNDSPGIDRRSKLFNHGIVLRKDACRVSSATSIIHI